MIDCSYLFSGLPSSFSFITTDFFTHSFGPNGRGGGVKGQMEKACLLSFRTMQLLTADKKKVEPMREEFVRLQSADGDDEEDDLIS